MQAPIIPLFCTATLAVDACLIALLSERAQWPDLMVAAVMGLAVGQINLATFWAVLGRRSLPWRIVVLLAVPIAWALAMVECAPAVLPDYGVPSTWAVHFLTQTVVFASLLAMVRLCGATLLAGGQTEGAWPSGRRQFDLRYLFAWLTSTAVALSLLKTTFEHAGLAETHFDWEGILVLGFSGAMFGLASAWPILDTRSRNRRRAAAMVTAVPAVLVVAAIVALRIRDREHLVAAVIVMLCVAGFYSATAWGVLRVAGFRLVWHGAMQGTSGEC